MTVTAHDPSGPHATLLQLGPATLHEALGRRSAIGSRIAPLDPGARMVGRALTVDARPADNLVLHWAVTRARPGDVLVVDAKGFTEAAVWGDVLTLAAMRAGVVGLVLDGAVRDVAATVALGFPVWCRAVSLNGPTKELGGRLDVPVTIDGCTVNPGDIVVADRDGVIAIRPDEVDAAITAGRQRERREAVIRERIAAGDSTVTLFGLGPALERAGLR